MQLHPLHCEELQANGRNIKTGPAFMPSPSEGLLTESCAGLQDCRSTSSLHWTVWPLLTAHAVTRRPTAAPTLTTSEADSGVTR